MDLHQYLTHMRRMRRGCQWRQYRSRSCHLYFLCFFYFFFFPGHILFSFSSRRHCGDVVHSAIFRKLVCWRMRSQIYLVESCTGPLMSVLCLGCLLCILYAFWLSGTCSFVVRHSIRDIWLVELKPCVTYSLLVGFNCSMSGACRSIVSVFLPDWPFCHRITKFLIRFTFGGSI